MRRGSLIELVIDRNYEIQIRTIFWLNLVQQNL